MNNAKPISVYFKKFLDFDSQLIRAFSYDKDYGPSFGLSLSTAMKITEGDFNSWYSEWKFAGDKLMYEALSSEKDGCNESSKVSYLAASVCYRTSDFFIRQNLDDPRIIPLADLQRDSFRKGFSKFNYGMKILNIPYEKTTLDGYLFTVDKTDKPRPTLIYTGGYDSFVEETFYSGVYQALLRGYNVLSYDGPGQGQVLRRQKLYMRPDWEKVLGPVIDFALGLKEIDSKKIILFGRSFAGYLVPRAACFDSRPAAIVADAGLYDLGAGLQKMMPQYFQDVKDKNYENVNKIMASQLEDKQKNFYFTSRMSVHNAKSVAEYLNMLLDYSLEGISKNINMPAFICSGEFDKATVVQSKLLYDNISSKNKNNIVFSGADGAGDHCEIGNQDIFYSTVFNWLEAIANV